ncbi:hypothetical protein [Brevibacillus laterosporus]|uniref:DUF7660 domain-containing protein n=1 Tax=Brevibacillus laterosporus TaxID=1465 RepID=A0AAP3DGI9_BRELA|nr:hypothetical protein [Brevibacillus laterosporus]MCR8979555.1 hypothetical protein [Brevibacillus laterosporus]MCZ0806710.1 hypothetical protein [Brevibacillus laterosporus]MCZ0828504.1 hypothetical protein [Brevibacillus laterosporus]MCZ0852574.1 hypothetical protein [Brevibacillus laterosporus]
MDIQDILEKVETKQDFIKFVYSLMEDLKETPNDWANTSLEDYFFGIARWVDDMDGLTTDPEEDSSEDYDWNLVATILFVGSRYE